MRNKILQWVPLAVLLIAWEAYASQAISKTANGTHWLFY